MCHNNEEKTMHDFKLEKEFMKRFKFHSKSFYLRLKHFYKTVEQGERHIEAYKKLY